MLHAVQSDAQAEGCNQACGFTNFLIALADLPQVFGANVQVADQTKVEGKEGVEACEGVLQH